MIRTLRLVTVVLVLGALVAGCAVSIDCDGLWIERTIKNKRTVDSLVAERSGKW